MLVDELRTMMKECEKGFNVANGICGAIDSVPIDSWVSGDGQYLDQNAAAIEALGVMDKTARRSLLSQAMPDSLRDYILAPCRSDIYVTFPVECHCTRYPEDYSNESFLQLGLDNFDEKIRGMAIKGMMAVALQCYFGNFLGRGVDAVAALHWPGDPSLALTQWQRLAFGVIREAVVMHHFESLLSFWKTFARMKRECGHLINFTPTGPQPFDRPYVLHLLEGDAEAIKIFEVMLDLGCREERINSSLHTMRHFMDCFGDEPGPQSIADSSDE